MDKILVVDDEASIVELLRFHLEAQGFACSVARDGGHALKMAKEEQPDLVVLDIMLPGMDGYDVCRELRRTGNMPIILLSAKTEELDRVLGLELGADDYVVKPFSPRELIARVKAVLRRHREGRALDHKVLEGASVVLEPASQRVFVDGREISLTYTEFAVLRLLMENKGMVLSRSTLLEKAWGYDFVGDSRTVDVHVRHLREKLEADPSAPELIETVRGVGYRFRAE